VRLFTERGIRVKLKTTLMDANVAQAAQMERLAAELGVEHQGAFVLMPRRDGDRSPLSLQVDDAALRGYLRRREREVPEAPLPVSTDGDGLCSAGRASCSISPSGDVYPCVQFPYPCGNVRNAPFAEIWKHSPQLAEVRAIRLSDVEGCSTCVHGSSCSRCPGLAYTEGNMRGPSVQDCERSYALTGVASENRKRKSKVIWLSPA
jgi:radical SAM protein with 4Fe4S-binding SPASM domain